MGFAGPLAGAGIGMGTLTANRQVAAVAQATVAAQVHQALDVHLNFAAQVALDVQVGIDMFANGQNLGIAQFVHATAGVDVHGFTDGLGGRMTDSGDISQGDRDPFRGRDVYAGNTCHVSFPFVAVP